MNTLQAGFSRVNVTPMMGIPMRGYFKERYAEAVLDDLEIVAVALACGETKTLLMAIDNLQIGTKLVKNYQERISEKTGIAKEAIFIHSTHTHTAGMLDMDSKNELVLEYTEFVGKRFVDVAVFALNDLKPAKMGWAVGKAPGIAFVRRFRMKDGKVRTNPGVGNPDILHPIGDIDDRVNVIRFDREGAETIVMANMGCHPDVVGGNKISADWPAMFRRRLEKSLDNVKAIFFNGAQGDINHVNVNAKDGDFNDTFHDFDDVDRGYGHARHMGNVMAGAVLQVYDKVNYRDVDTIRFAYKVSELPSNMPKPEDMPLARKYHELHLAGKDSEIPFKGMELTTVVAEAGRMVRLEHGPETFPLGLSAVTIGPVALLGIPGEPFNGIGLGIKEAKGWEVVMPCCLTNGSEGYFPMQDSYDEGGYEARSSRYKAGTAELIIEEGRALLDTLH
ncbi:MAG: hypothetical protein IKY18_05940 [Oscillospiraceae bacterium]|nr:hypothetical protein [Oscillospiraceae bacterium]